MSSVDSIVLFDGVCNLCARSVQFILEHENGPRLHFASIQSPAGERLMRRHGFDPGDAGTFLLVEGGRAHTRSDAALRVCAYLRSPWRALGVLAAVPRPLRDAAYSWVARHRYRWFGRRDRCLAPAPEIAARFLDEADGSP